MKTKHGGVVAAGSPHTLSAALEVLDMGGNAVDAAVGAAFATFVAEPLLTDIGGGGFMLVDRPDGARLYDFFVAVPGLGHRKAHPIASLDFGPIELSFGDATQVFHIGLGAAAVPGNVHGLCTAQAAEGRLTLAQVVAPAVRMGRQGVEFIAEMEGVLQIIAPVFKQRPALWEMVAPEGQLLTRGRLMRLPQTADLIEAIGQEGSRLFYEGEVAQAIVKQCREQGGLITKSDFSAYQTEVREPLRVEAFGSRIHLNPPPSTGGALIALGLQLAQHLPWSHAVHTPAGAVATAALFETVASARSEVLDTVLLGAGYQRHLLGDEVHLQDYLQRLRDRIRAAEQLSGLPTGPSRGATTHLSVVDSDGLAASITTSNGEGSGRTVGNYGIHLNNMLGEEDLNPGGFHLYPPGTRLPSMMCPSAVRKSDGTVISLGSGGANRLRTAITQAILRLLADGESLHDAVHSPRLHWERGLVDIEPGFAPEVYDALEAHGFNLRRFTAQNLYFGGVHAAMQHANRHFEGAGDPRRGGRSGSTEA